MAEIPSNRSKNAAGDAGRIVLLHGFPETGAAWARVTAALPAALQPLAPDLPGYGDTPAPRGLDAYRLDALAGQIIALADAHNLPRFDLVGHDWGGVIAWAVAALYPDRVRRLVILAAPHPDTMARVMRRHPRQILRSLYVGFFQLPWLPEAMLRARDFRMLRGSMVRTARPGTFSGPYLDTLAEGWAERLTTMLAYYRALRRRRAPIGRIIVPTLILWGARDRFLSTHLADAAAAMCDDARVEVRADVTHWLHHEEPAWVADRIAAFLGK